MSVLNIGLFTYHIEYIVTVAMKLFIVMISSVLTRSIYRIGSGLFLRGIIISFVTQ